MSLPVPNLDDRSFEEVVDEAIKLIPKYCPDWTDFNPSDPGITIIELLAWMTEMIIYRLNRVPEKNYIKFLELIGTTLKPPQAAQTWLVFNVANGAVEEELSTIPMRTRIASGEKEKESIIFETIDSLNLTASRIIQLCSKFQDQYADHSSLFEDEKPVKIFLGDNEIPHVLYLGDPELYIIDPKFSYVNEYRSLKLFVELMDEGFYSLNVEWEYWDGRTWNSINPSKDETLGLRKSGEIIFDSLPKMEEKEINKHSSFWLRAHLIGMDTEDIPKIKRLEKSSEIKSKHGLLPERGYLGTEKEKMPFFSIIDFSGIFYPFGMEPKKNDTFYIKSWFFSKKEAKIILTIVMADTYTPLKADIVKDLEICWEYYSKTGDWKLLGLTSARGVIKSEHGFIDKTEAFTKSGKISFSCPADLASVKIQGEGDFWIRARIIKGHYGIKEDKISPPLINTFLITYEEKLTPFKHYISYNYLSYKDLTPVVKKQESFEPFEIMTERAPAFYLSFSAPFSNEAHRVYFRFEEKGESLNKIYWEYLSDKGWKRLKLLQDSTNNFSQNGAIEFIPPANWANSLLFEKKGYWMRALLDIGNCSVSLKGAYLNAVKARHGISIPDEILGISNGELFQSFSFSQSPILPGPEIFVKELENPSKEAIKKLKEENIRDDYIEEEKDPDTNEVIAVWIKWLEVENFFKSGPADRHYTLDLYKGVVLFGDGRRGKIPPSGNNIKAKIYYVGGGAKGNVGRNTLTLLEVGIPNVDGVRNPDAAGGGADGETIEEAKLRGPWLLKHRYRAVTKEDFERLALEASGEVAKAMCFDKKEGEVSLIILPKGEEDKLTPKSMLIQRVKKYLDERRLISTKIEISGPSYVDISIKAEVIIEPQKIERQHEIEADMTQKLRDFFHPLKGGPKNEGWLLGRPVHISEIYYLLEKVKNVDYIKDVILNEDPMIERIEIVETGYPYLREVDLVITME